MREEAPPRLSRGAVLLLTLLVALGPLSTDLYLPALPAIRAGFAAPMAGAQATLSVFLIGFALAMLGYGPLSDRFGRRPVLLFGVVLFAASSALCALAGSIESLILFRLLQALGACAGPVVCRAVVRDAFGAAGAARVFSYLSAAVALAPAIGPILGGALAEFWGWRACFLFLALYGALGAALAWRFLPETNRQRRFGSLSPLAWLRTYRRLLGERRYLGFTLACTFGYSGIFCFISGSSFVLIDLLGVPPRAFGFCFAVFVLGYMIGALAGGRLSRSLGPERMVALGSALALASALLLAALALLAPPSVPAVLAPLFPFMIGIGMTLPNAQAGALAPFPREAGAASALLGFVQMTVAACLGFVLGWIGSPSPAPMALMIALSALLLLLSYRLIVAREGGAPAAE